MVGVQGWVGRGWWGSRGGGPGGKLDTGKGEVGVRGCRGQRV